MRDVVIIGGGLSGLSAAHELQRLNIPYRIIEVKNRLGGSLASQQRNGFVVDSGAFAFPRGDDWSFLEMFGLTDALCPVHDSHQREMVAFKNGLQTLLDALARPLTGHVLHRMAVTSLGQANGRFSICMENGLVFDAGALIVAAPARYAERMFRTMQPDLALRLLDYGYDTITRVSLGYRSSELPMPPVFPWDMAVAFYYWTDNSHRVPPEHMLLHVGVRLPPGLAASDALAQTVHAEVKAHGQPVMTYVDYWPEADPLPPHEANYTQKMRELRELLPPGIALVGSDYDGLELAARINSGRAAAQRVAAWLK